MRARRQTAGEVTHYPFNGNRMLKAVCGAVGLQVRKVTDVSQVTCPKCQAALQGDRQ